jgi:hypothetical protein
MSPAVRNILLVGAVHVAIVASVGAKFAIDRAQLPRAWVRAYATGPTFTMHGRYLSLRLDPAIRLNPVNTGSDDTPDDAPRSGRPGRLSTPAIVFFVPEGAVDPSRREPGEELWVEVTVPRRGPPRPIRLGVKKDGVLTPLELQ